MLLLSEAFVQANTLNRGNPKGRYTYEKPIDRKNQFEIATEFARVKGEDLIVQMHGTHSPFDAELIRKTPDPTGKNGTATTTCYFIECKQRRINKFRFNTLILSLHKWVDGLQQYMETGIPFIFAVRFKNMSIHYLEINKTPYEMGYGVRMGGRTSRQDEIGNNYFDPQDIELVVDIPMRDLIPLLSS